MVSYRSKAFGATSSMIYRDRRHRVEINKNSKLGTESVCNKQKERGTEAQKTLWVGSLPPYPPPAFCLWRNVSQRVSYIGEVRKYRNKKK